MCPRRSLRRNPGLPKRVHLPEPDENLVRIGAPKVYQLLEARPTAACRSPDLRRTADRGRALDHAPPPGRMRTARPAGACGPSPSATPLHPAIAGVQRAKVFAA